VKCLRQVEHIYPWSFVTQIFHSGQPSYGGDRKTFEVMTSTSPIVNKNGMITLYPTTVYLHKY
jgi:hypothetical protein